MRKTRSSGKRTGSFSFVKVVLVTLAVVMIYEVARAVPGFIGHATVGAMGQFVFGMAAMLTIVILAVGTWAIGAVARDVREAGKGKPVTGPRETHEGSPPVPPRQIIQGYAAIDPPRWESPR